MKIFEVLNKIKNIEKIINESDTNNASSNIKLLDDAKRDLSSKVIIYSKEKAKDSWISAMEKNNCKEYFDSIISILSQMAVLPPEELEKNYDIKKLTQIKFLVHNTNNKLKKVVEGLASSNISEEKTKALYDLLITYLEYKNPKAVDEFLNFYSNKEGGKYNNKISFDALLETAKKNNGLIPNFVKEWIPNNINNTLNVKTLADIAQIAPSVGSINTGAFELLLALLFEGGKHNQGTGGDILIGNYGIEIKASTGNSGYGKIGGQQTSFISSTQAIISNVQSAVKDFALSCYNLLEKDLQQSEAAQRIFNEYVNSDLQYSVDFQSWKNDEGKGSSGDFDKKTKKPLTPDKKWQAMTIDSAFVDIINTINIVNNGNKSKDITQVMVYAKQALVKIWSSWAKNIDKDVSELIDGYFTISLQQILEKAKETKKGGTYHTTEALIDDFDYFIKGIGFLYLKKYAESEKFNYILLANLKADTAFLLDSSILDNVLNYIKERKRTKIVNGIPIEQMVDEIKVIESVDMPIPSVFGHAGRGATWGVGTKGKPQTSIWKKVYNYFFDKKS